MGELIPDHEIRSWGYGKLSKCERTRTLYSEVRRKMEENPDSNEIVSVRLRLPAGRLREAVRGAEALGETLGQYMAKEARISLLPAWEMESARRKRARASLGSPSNRKRASKLNYSEVIKGQRSKTKALIASAPYNQPIEICLWVRVKDCVAFEKAKGEYSLTNWVRTASWMALDWLKKHIDCPLADTLGGNFWKRDPIAYMRI